MRQPLSELRIGTYDNVATASMDTPVIQVINMFVQQNISAVPIVDSNGVVLNVYETIDVMVSNHLLHSDLDFQLTIKS